MLLLKKVTGARAGALGAAGAVGHKVESTVGEGAVAVAAVESYGAAKVVTDAKILPDEKVVPKEKSAAAKKGAQLPVLEK